MVGVEVIEDDAAVAEDLSTAAMDLSSSSRQAASLFVARHGRIASVNQDFVGGWQIVMISAGD